MNELDQELLNIQNYITKTYQIKTEINLDLEDRKKLNVYAKKYNLKMKIADKTEDNYLNGDYGLFLDYEANRKYRSELNYRCGGRLEKYIFGDYKIIDEFLERFGIIKKESQMTIFDYEGVKE